jgi:hypothetical protein
MSKLFDGNGDYISIDDSDNWEFEKGELTSMDFWKEKMKHNYFHKNFRIGIFYFSIYWQHTKFSLRFEISTDNWN